MSGDVQTPSELIAAIRKEDRRYRRSIHLFFLVIALVLVGVIYGQFLQLQAFQDQQASRQRNLDKILSSQRSEQAKQTRYIQCISQFFATANRTNLVLTDLDKCNYQQNGQVVPGVDLTPTGSSSVISTNGSTTTTSTNNSLGGTQGTQSTATVDNSVLPGNPVANVQPSGPLMVALPVVPRQALTVDSCVPILQICVTN